MSERNPLRRVPFKEAGEGVELYLANSGTRTLFNDLGKDYFTAIERGLLFADIEILEKCLAQMAYKGAEKIAVKLDDLDNLSLQELCEKLLDAFSLSANGRTYKDQVAWLGEQAEKMAAEAVPPTAPGDISATSGAALSEPDSSLTSSTL